MNKIVLVSDKLKERDLDNSLNVTEFPKQDLFQISKIVIETIKDTDLFIHFNTEEMTKLQIEFKINHNLNLFILCEGSTGKIKYDYQINKDCKCSVTKYNSLKKINEMINIDLNGINSNINYIFKSIGKIKENYDYVIHHNCSHTISNIKNNGVNKEGTMNIQISGYIPKDINGCICNQNNRIINLTNNKCEIRPNLYINTDDVDANHSALIGKFSDEEMFYLNSRGINEVDATNLLIKGFLIGNINNETIENKINEDTNKYWR